MSRTMWRQLRSVFEGIQASNARAGDGGRGRGLLRRGIFRNTPVSGSDAAALRDFSRNDVGAGLNAMLACDVPIVARDQRAPVWAQGDCQLLRYPGGGRCGPLWRAHCQAGFPMAPREAQLVAAAVGETAPAKC